MTNINHSLAPLILLAIAFSGCGPSGDPDAEMRRRTEEQLDAIRSGKKKTLVCPHAPMLQELSEDAAIAANVEELSIWGDVSSPDFQHLASFPQLKTVSLRYAQGADAFLKHVSQCKNITSLSIDQTDLTGAGLVPLGQISTLTALEIISWDDMLSAEDLTQLTSLESLKILKLRVGPAPVNLGPLRSALPNCRIQMMR